MFTGITETMAELKNRTDTGLTIERPSNFDDIQIGSSICVSGVCLSVVKFDDASISFGVHEETWKRTKLGSLNAGDKVNLERAMKADSRFEGHVVQGHVDGVGVVVGGAGASPAGDRPRGPVGRSPGEGWSEKFVAPRGRSSAEHGSASDAHAPPMLTIKYPQALSNLIVEKGSIAIDGVSLTICEVDDEKFSVALIPHTLEVTTLGNLKDGDKVNLEADILGKYAQSNVV